MHNMGVTSNSTMVNDRNEESFQSYLGDGLGLMLGLMNSVEDFESLRPNDGFFAPLSHVKSIYSSVSLRIRLHTKTQYQAC